MSDPLFDLNMPVMITPPEPDEGYEHPNGSKWIVSVDVYGNVSILKKPNIHPGFFESCSSAEEIGLPFECDDVEPGVYEWVCNYVQHRDWETGMCDDGEFNVVSSTQLYKIE